MSLNRNLQRLFMWSRSQREVANLISGTYMPDIVKKWHKMQNDFDHNPSMPNPYEEVETRKVSSILC